MRRRLDDACRERCDGVDQVLAGIEDQQDALVAQIGHQARPHIVGADRESHHGRNAGVYQIGIAQHPEIDEQHGAVKDPAQMISCRDRDRGFADPAGADDADKARCGDLPGQLEDVVLPADHAIEAAGKIGVRKCSGNIRLGVVRTSARPRDRCDEAVTPPRKRGDVSGAVLAIPQRLAEVDHVESEAAFLDDNVGPDPRDQILLVDDFVRGRGQDDQDVECTSAQFDRHAGLGEEPFARQQIERAKRQSVARLLWTCRH